MSFSNPVFAAVAVGVLLGGAFWLYLQGPPPGVGLGNTTEFAGEAGHPFGYEPLARFGL